LEECPTSFVTAQSIEWIERSLARMRAGDRVLLELPAKEADAMLLLEQEREKDWKEFNKDLNHGDQSVR
jgi:hypothetical protein